MCYSGGFGSGKTTALVWRTIFLLTDSPVFGNMSGNVGLTGRLKLADFEKTTLPELERWLPRQWIRKKYRKDALIELVNESVLMWTHFETFEHLQSFNIGFCAFDQMEQIPFDVFKSVAYERIRLTTLRRFDPNTKKPADPPVALPYQTVFGACNPKRCWIYKSFVENDRYRQSADRNIQRLYNPSFRLITSSTYENASNLPPDYIERQKRDKSSRDFARSVAGSWDAFEGQVYDDFTDDLIHESNFVPRPDWPVYVGIDHGGTGAPGPNFAHNTTSVTFAALEPRDGDYPVVHVYDELFLPSSTIEETVTAIDDKLKAHMTASKLAYPEYWRNNWTSEPHIPVEAWRCDPSMQRRVDNTDETIMECYIRNASNRGFVMALAPGNNDVSAGIQKVSWLFRRKLLRVNPRCRRWIDAHKSYEYGKNEAPAAGQCDHPCLHGDTLIDTTNGRIPIKDLVGKTGHVYCYSEKDHRIAARPFSDVRKTGEMQEVIRVVLDNGKQIVCTPDHPFMTRMGEWVEAKDLTPKQSLMPFHALLDSHGHMVVHLNNGSRIFAHRLVYGDCVGELPNDSWTWNVHHKDFDKLNNDPSNLVVVSRAAHASMHKRGAKASPEALHNIRSANARRVYSAEQRAERSARLLARQEEMHAWRKTEDGHRWHVEHVAESIGTKVPRHFVCQVCGKPFESVNYHSKFCSNNCRAANGRATRKAKYNMSDVTRYRLMAEGVFNHKVALVEPYGFADVYNMEVEDTHNFSAEGVIVHNCDSTRYMLSALPLWWSDFTIPELGESIVQRGLRRALEQAGTQAGADPVYGVRYAG